MTILSCSKPWVLACYVAVAMAEICGAEQNSFRHSGHRFSSVVGFPKRMTLAFLFSPTMHLRDSHETLAPQCEHRQKGAISDGALFRWCSPMRKCFWISAYNSFWFIRIHDFCPAKQHVPRTERSKQKRLLVWVLFYALLGKTWQSWAGSFHNQFFIKSK